MSSQGREETLLGVAFESPYKGTQGEYTPQGPKGEKSFANLEKHDKAETAAPSLSKSIPPLTWQTQTENSKQDSAAGQANQNNEVREVIEPNEDDENPTYGSPCPWPKDLVEKIYPNCPTEANGLKASSRNLTEPEFLARVKDAISIGLKIKNNQVDEVTIPLMRRYDMESPEARIDDLLHDDRYRKRLINIFGRQNKRSEPKVLFIATHVVTCCSLSKVSLKKEEEEMKASGTDPSNTVPITINGTLHHIKSSTLQGTYKSNVILAMGYLQITYHLENETEEKATGLLSTRLLSRAPKLPKKNAHRFPRNDKSGICDVFWIADEDANGNVPAFFGDQSPVKEKGMFEDTTLVIGDEAAVEESPHDRFPPGFFGKDPVDDSEENVEELEQRNG